MKMHKLFSIILIVLFVMQAGVAIQGVIPSSQHPHKSAVVSQGPGSRLSPGEYTDHVPILINGTSDFTLQGWPGSGTAEDPYLLSGLNITTDISMACITVINTDAYFVIVDSWLNQLDAEYAIYLNNVGHAKIEYTSVYADSAGGIYVDATTSLTISHTYAFCTSAYPLLAYYSDNIILSNNIFNSTQYAGAYFLHCTNIQSTSNIYNAVSSMDYMVYLRLCDQIYMTNDSIIGPSQGGIYFFHSNNSMVQDLYIKGSNRGMYLTNAKNINISNCMFEDVSFAIYASFLEQINIFDCQFISIQTAFRFTSVSHLDVRNCAVDGATSYVANMFLVTNATMTNFHLGSIPKDGVKIDLSEQVTIDNLTAAYGMTAIIISQSHHVNIRNGQIEHFDEGISADQSGYISYTDGTMTNVDTMIEMSNTENITIEHTTAIGSNTVGYSFTSCINTTIHENTFSDVWMNAIAFDDSLDAYINDNTIDSCYNGISLSSTVNVNIWRNSFTNIQKDAIELFGVDNIDVQNNSITSKEYGLRITQGSSLVIRSNTFTSCGIYFDPGDPLGNYRHTISDNTVNSKPVLYVVDAPAGAIDGSQYGQVLLYNSSGTITGGSFVKCTSPIEVYYSDNVTIHSIYAAGNMYGIILYYADGTSISNTTLNGRGGSLQSQGVRVFHSDFVSIDGSTFEKFGNSALRAIDISYSDNTTVSDSQFFHNYAAIKSAYSDNTTIAGCTFYHTTGTAIFVHGIGAQNTLIAENDIYNATYGVDTFYLYNLTIRDNNIRHCRERGIYLRSGSSKDFYIYRNTVDSCKYGISHAGPDNLNIINNTLRWNTMYGLTVGIVAQKLIYGNIFIHNIIANGFDYQFGNYWDDGLSRGNYWDDYSGTGMYDVDGDTTDRYPRKYVVTKPIINHPMDVTYAEGSIGHEIVWYPVDDNLRNWSAFLDGAQWVSGIWNFNNITINIDGLPYGSHEIDLTVWDVYGNHVSDSVTVTVYDGTPPTISHEHDRIIFHNSPNQVIRWTAKDLHPNRYTVLVDGSEFANGTWSFTTETIGVDFQTLSVGTHDITMTVIDIDGNTAFDGVKVVVIEDDTAPTIDHPDDVIMAEGTLGNVIIWTPVDDNPYEYSVMINGSTVETGPWMGGSIVISLDGLTVGVYEFELTAYDGAYNSVTDSVLVHVLPAGSAISNITTTTTPPAGLDPLIIILILAGGAGTVIIVVILYRIHKKRSS